MSLHYRNTIVDDPLWINDGCHTIKFDNGSVLCSCNHLTHFAILLSPGVSEVSGSSNFNWEWLMILYPHTANTCRAYYSTDHHWTSVCISVTSVPASYHHHFCHSQVCKQVFCTKGLQIHVLSIAQNNLCNNLLTHFPHAQVTVEYA